MQPATVSLVSVEKNVWEILADNIRVGGVMGDQETVTVAARLMASKTGCRFVANSYVVRVMTEVIVHIFQYQIK